MNHNTVKEENFRIFLWISQFEHHPWKFPPQNLGHATHFFDWFGTPWKFSPCNAHFLSIHESYRLESFPLWTKHFQWIPLDAEKIKSLMAPCTNELCNWQTHSHRTKLYWYLHQGIITGVTSASSMRVIIVYCISHYAQKICIINFTHSCFDFCS